MIGSLRGVLDSVHDGGCVLDVNGVGYLVSCSRKTLDRLTAKDGAQKLLVETRVSQDAITLYGFAEATERDAFRALIEVKTVGPQKALLVLSGLTPPQLAAAIAAKERKKLSEVKGLGVAVAVPVPEGGEADAVSALVNLGMKRPEASAAVARAAKRVGKDAVLEALITEALKEMAPR